MVNKQAVMPVCELQPLDSRDWILNQYCLLLPHNLSQEESSIKSY